MAYIECCAKAGKKNNLLGVNFAEYIATTSPVELTCNENDIIVILSYGSYAEPVSGCSLVTSFQNYVKSQPRNVTILRTNSKNVSFKKSDGASWNYVSYMVITKDGEDISCDVTSLANSSSYVSGNVTINTNANDLLVFPNIPPSSSSTYTFSNSKFVSDSGVAGISNYHIYVYRVFDTSSVVSFTYAQLDSVIHLS